MRRVELAEHNGQLHLDKVRVRLRRKLISAISQGECLLIDADKAAIGRSGLEEIIGGLPENKAKVIRPYAHVCH